MAHVLHPPVTAALDAALRANQAQLWTDALRTTAAARVLVPRAMASFDAQTTTFAADWASLDDHADRVARVRGAGLEDAVVEELVLQRGVLNAALTAAAL